MKALNALVKDSGANFVCLVESGKVGVSTFPPAMSRTVQEAARVFLQLFLSASSIQRSYQELYISFEYYGLTALRLSQSVTVILCTPPSPNIEKIKSAIVKHQHDLLAELGAHYSADAFDLSDVAREPKTKKVVRDQKKPHRQSNPVLDEAAIASLQTALAEHVGPAAKILWTRAYQAWLDSGETVAGLDVMIDTLSSYVDQPDAKRAFIDRAKLILQP